MVIIVVVLFWAKIVMKLKVYKVESYKVYKVCKVGLRKQVSNSSIHSKHDKQETL